MHFGFDNSKNMKWRNGKFTSQMSTRQACHFEFCSIFLTIFWFYLFSSLLFRAPTFATWQTGQSHLCASLSFQSWITSVYSPCFLSTAPVLFSWYIWSFVSVFFTLYVSMFIALCFSPVFHVPVSFHPMAQCQVWVLVCVWMCVTSCFIVIVSHLVCIIFSFARMDQNLWRV